MSRVMGLGQIVVDLRCYIPAVPEPDDVAYANETTKELGGMTAVAMATVAKLGGSCEIVSGVGDDEHGAFALSELKRVGVGCENVRVFAKESTPYSFVMVDDLGRRTIVHDPGVQRKGLALPFPDLAECSILHIDGAWVSSGIVLARKAKERGTLVTVDVGTRDRNPRLVELFQVSDFVIVPEGFATGFTSLEDPVMAAESILDEQVQAVILTRAERGSVIVTRDYVKEVPAFDIVPLDTTGAGDSFRGGFIYALSRGFSLIDSVVFASAVAAVKCSRKGGVGALPNSEEIREFLVERNVKWTSSRRRSITC